MSMLRARGVSKVFAGGVTALDGVDLEVAEGEVVALIGESGCGKSTLLRMFNRTQEPTHGEVLVAGVSVEEEDPIELRRRVGYVPQDGGLLPHWTVERNVALVPWLLGWEEEEREQRTREMLALVGLDPRLYARRFPTELSGGQMQRVAFARALAADPAVILLDEPFGALDALTRRDLQQEFARITETLRKTMLLVTHDLEEAFLLADRVAVMNGGRILQSGTRAELLAAPADPYVQRLLQPAAFG